jgi:hypothetical protein
MRDLILQSNLITIEDYKRFLSSPHNAEIMTFLEKVIYQWALTLDEKSILCLMKGVSLIVIEAFERIDSPGQINA